MIDPQNVAAVSRRSISWMRPSPVQRRQFKIVRLGYDDVPRMLDLERNSWIPSLQVSEATICTRMDLGHVMLGAERDGRLLGMIASCFNRFSPSDAESFPKTFAEYSSLGKVDRPNAAFVYNLNVERRNRGCGVARGLMLAGMKIAGHRACHYVVGDGRCPSYNGSTAGDLEQIRCRPRFRDAIDRYIDTGEFPSVEELIVDPVLRFYYRHLHCRFAFILPGFIPSDVASGGFRVIFYKRIAMLDTSFVDPYMSNQSLASVDRPVSLAVDV